jgi:hypothetical protein
MACSTKWTCGWFSHFSYLGLLAAVLCHSRLLVQFSALASGHHSAIVNYPDDASKASEGYAKVQPQTYIRLSN